ncbi:MAG: hypothetical protein N3C12_10805 [Candidatus Binatia bacterium]|nr:hypothetical protein [Candidatus Binatia bacterium]
MMFLSGRKLRVMQLGRRGQAAFDFALGGMPKEARFGSWLLVWWVSGRRKRSVALLFAISVVAGFLAAPHAFAQPVVPIAEQLLAAQRQALAAERAARLAERAAQKIADAVRAERRTVWLERTAQGLRARGGREYLAARRGADLARRERNAVVDEARALTRKALEAMDGLLETPAGLQRALPGLGEGTVGLSERVAEHAARLREAALAAREALLKTQAVQVRVELTRAQLTETRAGQLEESLARRRAALADSLDRLVRTAEALTQAAEDLDRAARLSSGRAVAKVGRRAARRWGAGLGIAFNVDIGGKDRVETARIVEDPKTGTSVVRVDRTSANVPRAMAEVHYLFPLSGSLKAPRAGEQRSSAELGGGAESNGAPGQEAVSEGSRLAVGPFFGVQFGDDFVDAVGAGMMVGWRLNALVPRDQLQVGVGYFADPNTRVLGDGFSPDRPPPAGETQVRYKETTKGGIVVLMTYGF